MSRFSIFLPLQDHGEAFKCISQIRMMEIDHAAVANNIRLFAGNLSNNNAIRHNGKWIIFRCNG